MMYRYLALFVLFLGSLPASAGAGVMITSVDHRARAYQNNTGAVSDSATSHAIPWSDTATANAGGTTTRLSLSRTPTIGGYQLQSNFSLFVSPMSDSVFQGQSWVQGDEHFTVDADMPYSIAGLLSILDGALNTYFRMSFRDLTTGEWLAVFRYGNSDGNTDFELGALPAEEATGSLTGILTAGHQYQLSYSAFIDNFEPPNRDPEGNGVTANGYLTLTIGTPIVVEEVPEPASLIVWGLLGSCAAATVYRRRKRAVA